MSKIYIVQSSHGEYEDYRETNEKAFYNKEDAEKYAKELDARHRQTPEFITEDFISAYNEIIPPEWPDAPCKPYENRELYQSWLQGMIQRERQFVIQEMYKQGFFLTEHMIDTYEDWEDNQYIDWHDCTIEEIELV